MNLTDLSTDQQYLLDMCHAISTGNVQDNLASRAPGNLSHARWLTTANRILRLYITEVKPSMNLVKLVKYVLQVYAPTWFEIKKTTSCSEGAKLLHNMIVRTQIIKNKGEKEVVQKSISTNGYFAHHENIILSMIFDSDENVRNQAVNIIRSVKEPKDGEVRKFKLPVINFKAKHFFEMVDLARTTVTVPPLLSNIKVEDLFHLWKSPRGDFFKLIPCHSQAVERSVKVVSEASRAVSQKRRQGYILSKIYSRNEMPIFNTKREFNFNKIHT